MKQNKATGQNIRLYVILCFHNDNLWNTAACSLEILKSDKLSMYKTLYDHVYKHNGDANYGITFEQFIMEEILYKSFVPLLLI